MTTLFSIGLFLCLCSIGYGAIIPREEWNQRSVNNTRVGIALPAYCSVSWTFGMDCISFRNNLIKQLMKWNGPDNCKNEKDPSHPHSEQNCNYQLVSASTSSVAGFHSSINGQTVDSFTFGLTQQSYGCSVNSESHTMDTAEIYDNGRNFCNMWNLVEGSGMSDVPKFSRDSSNRLCTQFTSAKCHQE